MNKIRTIFSENPEIDLWEELLAFSYDSNVRRYLLNSGKNPNSKVIDVVTSSFLQANEYFRSAREASIQIAPLLLYYGSSNLLNGLISLVTGSAHLINNHGMKINAPSSSDYIADTQVQFFDPQHGGIHVFAQHLNIKYLLTNYQGWTLHDFLDSIAEIHDDYMRCYENSSGRIVMLEDYQTPDGPIQRAYYTEQQRAIILDALRDVESFDDSYLPICEGHEHDTSKQYFILRRKLAGKNICCFSYSGQPYLRAGHRKNSTLVTLPTVINMYIALFVLGSLCRYHAYKWSPFIMQDKTGEKLLIEKFLFYARRMIPNYVLDIIFDERTQYSSNRYEAQNTIKSVGEHQIREMIDERIHEALESVNYQTSF